MQDLPWRLRAFWGVYQRWMKSKTRDTSEYGYHYLSGLLRMDEERNIANIGRQTGVPEQNMQHFISQSPWSGRAVIAGVQQEIALRGELSEGALLLLDESADDKAGGAGRSTTARWGCI